MIGATNQSQKHKHCQPNCVFHNKFICSLRKYSFTQSTTTNNSKNKNIWTDSTVSKDKMGRKKSMGTIRAFKEVNQPKSNVSKGQHLYNQNERDIQQIETLIMRVSLQTNKNNQKIQKTQHNKIPIKFKKQTQKPKFFQKLDKKQIGKNMDLQSQLQNKLSIVKDKDIKELQFNVDRISNIIEKFNKKLNVNKAILPISLETEAPKYCEQVYTIEDKITDSTLVKKQEQNYEQNIQIFHQLSRRLSNNTFIQDTQQLSRSPNPPKTQQNPTKNQKTNPQFLKLNYKMYTCNQKLNTNSKQNTKVKYITKYQIKTNQHYFIEQKS